MNYAIRTNDSFVARKPISTKRKMTAEQKAKRAFVDSHVFSVKYNKRTGEATIHVTEKKP